MKRIIRVGSVAGLVLLSHAASGCHGKHEAAGETKGRPPPGDVAEKPAPSALPLEPPARPAAVVCRGSIGTSSEFGCMFIWSACSDGATREVRCDISKKTETCLCILGAAEISTFESTDWCGRSTGVMSVDRPVFTEAARSACGWRLGP